jgi:hypothetical protein
MRKFPVGIGMSYDVIGPDADPDTARANGRSRR